MNLPQIKKHKVIIWATGPIGRAALYHALTSPDMELVGVWVHSEDKDGKDAGDIVGLPKSGILCTRDKAKLLGLPADVVMYCPAMHLSLEGLDGPVLEILESGKNVITPNGYWFPPVFGADYVLKLEEVCRRKGVRLYGGGENPGFWLERLGVAATGLCSKVDSLKLQECIDLTKWPSWTMVHDTLGFGKTVDNMSGDNPIVKMLNWVFEEEIGQVAQILGFDIDEVVKGKPRYATVAHEVKVKAGVIPPNTVAAQNYSWSGMCKGEGKVTISNTWFVERNIPGWALNERWIVSIGGRPCVKMTIDTPVSLDDPSIIHYPESDTSTVDYVTAMPLMNAIPDLLAMPPGIIYPSMWGAHSASRALSAAKLAQKGKH